MIVISAPSNATFKFELIDYRARASFAKMKLSAPSSPTWYGKTDHENSNSLDVEPGYLKKLEAMEQDAPSDPYGSIPIGDLMRQTCGDSLLRTCIVSMSLYTPLIKNGSEAESGPAKAIVASIADTAAHYAWGRIVDALNKRGNKMTVEQLSRRIHECPDPTGPVPVLQSYGLPRARVLLGHDCYLQDIEHACADSGLCTSVYGYIADTTSEPGPQTFTIENITVESYFDLDDNNDLDKTYAAAGNIEHFKLKDWTLQYRREIRTRMEILIRGHNEKIAAWLGKKLQLRLKQGEGVEDLVPGEDFGQYFIDVDMDLDKFLMGAMDQTREFFTAHMGSGFSL
ncbi:uncharacterized protein NECHADRAFT_86367 [Fusarium vanettenii 77-13-4]|uniref:Uncharacterized protein n=1 Tax=Fusarium vanettenii (strain ATCC MYA-4622 / CBS 123669 / FGSC 9596 / NRRL 45880 / 77-13-4) TaxID=660122 RepID=C7ZF26_FUSV7|nr:uncharacterized protein NECHADRAFT_86367 [Fusarium vanettenii 77-13-4]EEU37395.1 predicted protein [Fusarium vanettenii 77-13-4]